MENLQSLVPEILTRLSRIEKLPDSGFLAGGSVANTILSIIDGKEYPINDIDIFIPVSDDFSVEKKTAIVRFVPDSDGYSQTIVTLDKYKIVNTLQSGLLNLVYIEISPSKTDEIEILKTFDINQTQVGINLQTGKIYYTKEFADFLKTRQLKMSSGYTPFQTIVRLLEKSQYAYLNLDLEIQKAIACLSTGYINRIMKKSKAYQLYMEKYRSILDKHFYLIKDSDPNFFVVYPKESFKVSNEPSYVYSIPKVLDRIYYSKKSEKAFLNNLLNSELLCHILLLNPYTEYFDVPFHTISSVDSSMKKIASDYFYLLEKFTRFDLYELIHQEMHKKTYEILKELLVKAFKSDDVEIAKSIIKSDLDIILKQPFDVSGFVYKDSVKEITTLKELNFYADKFKNCLKSYDRDISSGNSLVFVILPDGEYPSVVEYRKDEYGIWRTYQHKAKFNGKVEFPDNLKIALLLERYIQDSTVFV